MNSTNRIDGPPLRYGVFPPAAGQDSAGSQHALQEMLEKQKEMQELMCEFSRMLAQQSEPDEKSRDGDEQEDTDLG